MSTYTYKSTRGQVSGWSFEQVVMGGLAPDGGLFIPENIPQIQSKINEWSNLDYKSLCYNILRLYIDPKEVSDADLQRIITASYHDNFRDQLIAPCRSVGPVWILELFHGPTYSFKDVALQFLGNLFEYFLTKPDGANQNQHITILGATSGDTGSAAIHGMRGKQNIQVFILYPQGKVSPIQELQMTSILDPNVHCLAVKNSTFDDAQNIVKSVFGRQEFKQRHNISAVNSINWARILAQIVYYFHAYYQLVRDNRITIGQKVNFSVPTGNFGDILAGYYARAMGLPIDQLIVATNENDILDRFFKRGEYHQEGVKETSTPSMDIQISSNFERYLYYLSNSSASTISDWMNVFKTTGKLTVEGAVLDRAQQTFKSSRVSEEDIKKTIKEYYEKFQYVLDPHTAVGVKAGSDVVSKLHLESTPLVCLGTAHPAKFAKVVTESLGEFPNKVMPEELTQLSSMPTKSEEVNASEEEVMALIENTNNKSHVL